MLDSLKFLLRVAKHRHVLKPVVATHLYYRAHADYSMWGSISETDEAGIADAVKQAGGFPGPIVEIGVLFGHTTNLIATLKAKDKALIGVDNFAWNPFSLSASDHRIITRRTLRYVMDHCQTSLFEGSNVEFYQTYHGPTPSMVFIDADHTYDGVTVDLAWAKRLRIPVVCGHDYDPQFPGVVKAVDEAFGKNVRVVGSVWIASAA